MQNLRYKYPVDSLFTGASLGNAYTFARLDAHTNLKGLWSSIDNQFYVGEWNVEIQVDGNPLVSRETLFTPESQTTCLAQGAFRAEKQFFLPFVAIEQAIENKCMLQSAIFLLRLHNDDRKLAPFVVRHSLIFPAVPSEVFTKQPSLEQTKKHVQIQQNGQCIEITGHERKEETRVLGPFNRQRIVSEDNQMIVVETFHEVAPGEMLEIPVVLSYSNNSLEEARDGFRSCCEVGRILQQTLEQYRDILDRTHVIVPEPLIYRGIQWAKINAVRVQHRYRIGWGFTNDPPQDIVVVRDLAWYILGGDYITPFFSDQLLSLAAEYGFHEGGKLTEYIHADEDPPKKHDYNLNINDDTPLYMCALYHHALLCENEHYLSYAYPRMQQAACWILSQMKDGLVWAYASGTSVFGICGWRNIIDGYNLSGAITEINAECYYALKLTGEVARRLQEDDDAERFLEAAEQLKHTINATLVSEKTGLYLLHIDDGKRHHDVTGDIVFPVMFDVAEGNIQTRVLECLTDGKMWTRFGSRTVSPEEENYDPDFGYQLLGGIWPNLTAWIAYCLRENDPQKLVEGMMNIYKLCEAENPRKFVNLVPGQFPERLHGEIFESRGMSMSPWMPPTYLWLGVEGLLGVRPTFEGLEISPNIPSHWNWIAVKDLLYKKERISMFFFEGTVYSTHPVLSRYPVKVGSLLATSTDVETLFSLALEVDKQAILFVACLEPLEGSVILRSHGATMKHTVSLRGGEAQLIRTPLQSEFLVRKPSQEEKR